MFAMQIISQLLLESGARHERTLQAIDCTRVRLIEAPSSAHHCRRKGEIFPLDKPPL
jgi:hypothetical protein